MRIRINWKKTLLVTLDLVLGAYVAYAFVGMKGYSQSDVFCKRVQIDIQDGTTNGFLSAKDISTRLRKVRLYPLGRSLDSINVRAIEETLLHSPFVRSAQCYVTQDGQVNIQLTQRMPMLRVKTDKDDYYLDDNNNVMRPSSRYTADLIVATGHFTPWFAQNYLSPMVATLMQSKLWKNQVEQIHVLEDGGIEIVPRVGDHVVLLGRLPQTRYAHHRSQLISEFVQRKLNRLEKFYRYGLSQVGWNKYSYIDLEFDNQIICKRRTFQQPPSTPDGSKTQEEEAVPMDIPSTPSSQTLTE